MTRRRPAMRDQVRALWRYLDKHERWQGLYEIEDDLSDRLFFDQFAKVWINSESNDLNLDLIDDLIERRNITAARLVPHLTKAERTFFANLPDRFKVWRGTTLENLYCDYSWTVDEAKARWFAVRCHDATPALVTGWVNKADILFASNDRGESEIAVPTDRVADKQVEQIGDHKLDTGYALFAAIQGHGYNWVTHTALLVAMVKVRIMHGEEPDAVLGSYWEQVEMLAGLGFWSAAADREGALMEVDWEEVLSEEAVRALKGIAKK